MRIPLIAVLLIGCSQAALPSTAPRLSEGPPTVAPSPTNVVTLSPSVAQSPSVEPEASPLLTSTPAPPKPTPVGDLIPLWTASAPPPTSPITGRQVCDLAHVGGILAGHPESGLGLTDRRGRRIWPVIWLFGFTARATPDGIVLIDAGGSVVAREGDRIEAAGGTNVEGVTYICSP